MRTLLLVAEKPSIAKQLSYLLSNTSFVQNRTLKSIYNWVYEFDQSFQGQNCRIIITSVTGHLKNLKLVNVPMSNWNSIQPIIILKESQIIRAVDTDKLDVSENLQILSQKATDLFLWLDCDREGEAIAYEVIEECLKVNNNLNVIRAKFSSLQKNEVFRAFQNPIAPNKNLNDAVLCRQEIDLRTGAAFTRHLTLLIKDNYPEINAKFISYGPCQFPTLAFVVSRFLDNKNFIKSLFYYLHIEIERDQKKAVFKWEKDKHFNKHMTFVLFYYLKREINVLKIIDVQKRKGTKYKPYPLKTVDLQKLAVKKLNITSDELMKHAEKLYTQGYISYPRTETDIYPKTMDFQKVLNELQQNQQYSQYIQQMAFQVPRQGKSTDEAHPPIHPVKNYDKDQSTKEFEVYDLIARRFIANCSLDAKTAEVVVTASVEDEYFYTKGLVIVERNFLDIYEKFYYIKENTIPEFRVGEEIELEHFFVKEGVTAPPPLLTESDLIQLMDKNGVGTDATIHEHIKNVQVRQYVQKRGKVFVPTQLGIALICAYDELDIPIGNPLNWAETEKIFEKVAKGQMPKKDALESIMKFMIENYDSFYKNQVKFIHFFEKYVNQFSEINHIWLQTPENVKIPSFNSTSTGEIIISKCSCQGSIAARYGKTNKKLFFGCVQFPRCKKTLFFKDYQFYTKIENSIGSCQCGGKSFILTHQERTQKQVCANGGCQNFIGKLLISAQPRPNTPTNQYQNNNYQQNNNLNNYYQQNNNYNNNQNRYNRNQPNNNRYNNNYQNNQRVIRCYRCQQEGHYANNCPNQYQFLQMQVQRKVLTRLAPFLAELTDIHYFRFNMLFDLLLFLPIIVMFPFTIFTYIAQRYYITLENPFFFAYAIIRIFLFVMLFFIVVVQYILMIKGILSNDETTEESQNKPIIQVLVRYSLELVLYLLFFAWTLYLGVNFYRVIVKHQDTFDENVSIDEEQDSIYLEDS